MRDERELKFSEIEEDDELISGRMYHFRDPVVERVVGQFVDRSNVGYKKYKQTLDSERRNGVKDLGDYLQDIQEELMDAKKQKYPPPTKSSYYGSEYTSNQT